MIKDVIAFSLKLSHGFGPIGICTAFSLSRRVCVCVCDTKHQKHYKPTADSVKKKVNAYADYSKERTIDMENKSDSYTRKMLVWKSTGKKRMKSKRQKIPQ